MMFHSLVASCDDVLLPYQNRVASPLYKLDRKCPTDLVDHGHLREEVNRSGRSDRKCDHDI